MDDQARVTTYGNLNLPEGTDERPLVTFALFAYNQEKYIREAVEGAFSQTYSPLEIILSDDCSSDRTFEIMQEMAAAYEGPHQVIVRHSKINDGLAEHVNNVIHASMGTIIVMAAGDDISLPSRVENTVILFARNSTLTALSFETIVFSDKEPVRPHLLSFTPIIVAVYTLNDVLRGAHINGASRAIRRTVHETYGPLNSDCPTEDTPYLLRAAMIGHVARGAPPQVLYRWHENNLSSAKSIRTFDHAAISRQYDKDFSVASTINSSSIVLAFNAWKKRQVFLRHLNSNNYSALSEYSFYDALRISRGLPTLSRIKMVMRFIRHLNRLPK